MKEEDWKTYSKEDILKYTSIKGVLTHRAQFNTRKKEIYKRLCANFDVMREYEIPTKINDKEKKKRKVIKRGKRDQDSISRWEKWKTEYQDKLNEIKDEQKFLVHGKEQRYNKNALGLLTNKNKLRILMVWLIHWPWFERVILLLIILNSISLGLKNYTDTENVTPLNQKIDSFEIYFTSAFVIEAIVKIIAMGFVSGHRAYLTDPWNWLDLTVVISSLLE